MTDRPTGTPPGIAVGMRVREREMRVDRPPRTGTVVGLEWSVPPGAVRVRWDGDGDGIEPEYVGVSLLVALEPDAPPVTVSTAPADLWDGPVTISTEYVYAPERALAPGIVQSDDTSNGEPRIEGTNLRCDKMHWYWKREVAEGHGPGTACRHVASTYGTTPEAIRLAVVWEAAVRYTDKRHKATRKAKH